MSHLAWFEEQAELAARSGEVRLERQRTAQRRNRRVHGGRHRPRRANQGRSCSTGGAGRAPHRMRSASWTRRRGSSGSGRRWRAAPSSVRVMETAHGTDVADALEVPLAGGAAPRGSARCQDLRLELPKPGASSPRPSGSGRIDRQRRRGAPLERERNSVRGGHARGLLAGGDPAAPRRRHRAGRRWPHRPSVDGDRPVLRRPAGIGAKPAGT